ncbi:unnamed protein product [marine sediment metagenome]|uniref:Uncharacterized protein n=1 Tax=marine sediment metagenome TaxID=412755 RepID=X1V2M9_9ZZZZ
MTGTYNPIGSYNDKPSYQLADNSWFLWWNGFDKWMLSMGLGDLEAPLWSRADPAIEGLYSPEVPATGDATVTVIA